MRFDKRVILVWIDYAILPTGLILMGTGLWMYCPWVSLAVTGAIMTFFAIAVDLWGRK
jgi:hypothetical protein